MKKSELKQLIKEQVMSMGYVDASMAAGPLSDRVVNSLVGNRKIVKESKTNISIDYLDLEYLLNTISSSFKNDERMKNIIIQLQKQL